MYDSDDKESVHSVGDLSSIPGLGRSPEEGNGNPLQYSCLENSMDRGNWQATDNGVQSQTQVEQLTHILYTCIQYNYLWKIQNTYFLVPKYEL